MAHILAIGIATLDIINSTDGFPPEDSEVRALNQHIRRGGNATNTLTVLSQLGHDCTWLGTLAVDDASSIIMRDLDTNAINHTLCPRLVGSRTPTSYITLNIRNGSRTIVHHRNLAELRDEDFLNIDFKLYDWMHFEGRNPAVYAPIIKRLAKRRNPLTISVEIEKDRQHIDELFIDGITYVFSRHFAVQRQFTSAVQLLHWFKTRLPNSLLVCTWGKAGSAAVKDGREYTAAAVDVATIVDTVGAGDTYNAGLIHALLHQLPLSHCLRDANALAAKKCLQWGFDNLL